MQKLRDKSKYCPEPMKKNPILKSPNLVKYVLVLVVIARHDFMGKYHFLKLSSISNTGDVCIYSFMSVQSSQFTLLVLFLICPTLTLVTQYRSCHFVSSACFFCFAPDTSLFRFLDLVCAKLLNSLHIHKLGLPPSRWHLEISHGYS